MTERIEGSETPEEKQQRIDDENAERFRRQRNLLEEPEVVHSTVEEYLRDREPLTDEEKEPMQESQRRLGSFRSGLEDQDKLGPVK